MEQLEPLRTLVEAFGSAPAPKILLLGDSVARRVAIDDACRTPLDEMVAAAAPVGVCRISASAFHSQVYCLLCSCLQRLPYRPDVVVVPVNLRSFSPAWDLHPEYQFLWETAVLDAYAQGRACTLSPPEVTAVAHAIFRAAAIHFADGTVRTHGDFLDCIAAKPPQSDAQAWAERLKAVFTLHYMHPLRSEHRKLRYFGTMIKTLRRLGIACAMYISPINHRAGIRFAGPSFEAQVRRNIACVSQFMTAYGVQTPALGGDASLVDLAFAFGEEAFFTPYNATEHLRHEARRSLALTLVDLARATAATSATWPKS